MNANKYDIIVSKVIVVFVLVTWCSVCHRRRELKSWNTRLNTFSLWTRRTVPFRRTLSIWRDITSISGSRVCRQTDTHTCRQTESFMLLWWRHGTSVCCFWSWNRALIRSTLRQSRPNQGGLKCPSIRTSVRLSVWPQSFFDFNEMWRVGRGRWVMHDSMQYDPIQGQSQGHDLFKVGNLAILKSLESYLLRHLQWKMATDHGFLN